MSADLTRSWMTLRYTPDGGAMMSICEFGSPLLSEPETTWELQTQTCDAVGAPWAADRATGNARRRVVVHVPIHDLSESAMVRRMRHDELVANTQREGTVLWQEAFVQGRPTYAVRWTALVMACNARRLRLDEIPSDDAPSGEWGCLEWELQLTNPTEL